MGFKVKARYEPGPAPVQVYSSRMALLKTAHEINLTKSTAVCIIADNKILSGTPQVNFPVWIFTNPYPVVFICCQEQGSFLCHVSHHFTHSWFLHKGFVRL